MNIIYEIWKKLDLYKKLAIISFLIGVIGYIPQFWFLNYLGFLVSIGIGQYVCEGYDFFNKCLFLGYLVSPFINAGIGFLIGLLISKLKK